VVLWRAFGSWSGRNHVQTESFTSDSGMLRIAWKTTHETKPNAGAFKLTMNSAVSGRTIATIVDERGVGDDTAYVNDDPRAYYAVVESSNLDWTFTVEEGTPATVDDKPARQ
jgi:hypothetical protein